MKSQEFPAIPSAGLQSVTLQLSVMINAGVHIVRAIMALAQSPDRAVRLTMLAILKQVESGATLSAAMSRCPQTFSPLYLRSIRVAERSGQLARVLELLAGQLELQQRFRQRMRAALAYPLCVVTLAGLMTLFMIYVQVPAFLHFFRDTGAPLPVLTAALAFVSRPEFGLLGAGLLAALVLAWRVEGGTAEGSWRQAQRLAGLPVVGRLLLQAELIQLSTDLSLLLAQGVDSLSALATLNECPSGSPLVSETLGRIIQRLEDGVDFPGAFEAEPIYPGLMIAILKSSDETGQLSVGLKWYSQLAGEQLQHGLDSLITLIEPMVMLFLGTLVMLILASSFLPMYGLLNLN